MSSNKYIGNNKLVLLICALDLACVQTSPVSFVVPFPRATKEIGDVCTQATLDLTASGSALKLTKGRFGMSLFLVISLSYWVIHF